MSIEREYSKRVSKMAFPPHEVIEKEGRRIYRRRETGGTVRTLVVWTLEGCRQRIKDRMSTADGARKWFDEQVNTLALYAKEPVDPMFLAWFSENYAIATQAYDELVAPSVTAIENFGFNNDELEVFGA